MTRISISNAALEGIFHERMKAFVECPPEMKIAIASVESKRWGWMAITKPSDRIAHPDCHLIGVREHAGRYKAASPARHEIDCKPGSTAAGLTRSERHAATSLQNSIRGALDSRP